MLLIYSPNPTIRLQYICKFIFEEILCTSYSLTFDEASFIQHDGNKINYSLKSIANVFQIEPHELLFELDVKERLINCFDFKNTKAFFKTENSDYAFDIFAASFYLITRYEEYLPHTKDMYGRYAHENSIAFKEGFLNKPVVNIWLADFKRVLHEYFPDIIFKEKSFFYLPTYDIDMAWVTKEKGLLRNIGGFFKNPSIEKFTSFFKNDKDPYDCYDFLDGLHKKNNLHPIYFFLVAKENGIYDKNILPTNEAMQTLIKQHSEKYAIGIHPSWKSYDDVKILAAEKDTLEKITSIKVEHSRQHFIKLTLPETYNRLISQGIYNDYSMGYGTANGFRASVASSFFWFDLGVNNITKLRIHPFCFMEANSHYEQKLTVNEAYKELMYYYETCKNINGNLITIFHNNFLGTSKEFEGWRELYERFIGSID